MILFAVMSLFLAAVAEAAGSPALSPGPLPPQGIASWYSKTDPCIKKKTANGEIFDDTLLTCASWHYPIGSYLKITNVKNGKSVICRVNDRGPKRSLKRVVDLTKSSFRKIANPKHGVAQVTIKQIKIKNGDPHETLGKSPTPKKYNYL